MTMPFGTATLARIAPVTPEQSAPMIAFTLSVVTRRSAAEVAAAASTQVLSPRTEVTVEPPSSLPESVTSFIAISAPAAIAGVIDSSGPVKPRITPILMSSAPAAPAMRAAAAVAARSFFMRSLPVWNVVLSGKLERGARKEKPLREPALRHGHDDFGLLPSQWPLA